MPKKKLNLQEPPEAPKLRNQHEGTREVLPSGLIRYRAEVNGQRVSGSAQKTDLAAVRALRRKIAQVLNPVREARAVPSLAEYCYDTLDGPYRELVRNEDMSDQTWDLYEQITRLNVETHPIGALSLDELEPYHLEGWARELMTQERERRRKVGGKTVIEKIPPKPLAASSKARYIGFLSGVLERARKVDKYIQANPAHDVAKPTPGEVSFRILTKKEVGELLEAAKRYQETANFGTWKIHAANPRLLEMICLLGLHGLGPAEMCGADSSFMFALVGDTAVAYGFDVREQSKRGKIKRKLKSPNRSDYVAIDGLLADLIRKWPEGRLLQTKNGTPMSENNVRRLFASMVKGTKFQGMTPYDLRHTFAMRMLEEGHDVRTVAEQMRNTPDVVLRRYVKSRPQLKIRAVQGLFPEGSPTESPTEAKNA